MSNSKLEQVNETDKDAVIVDAGEKNEVLDFLDYLEISNHPSAIKIRNLRQYLSDEELLTFYSNIIGTGVSKDSLESSLESFFTTLATHITELPNGIVIDLKTGLVDVDKSFEQALNVGIYSKDSVIVDSGKTYIEELKEMDVLHLLFDELEMNYDSIEDYNPSFLNLDEIMGVYSEILHKDEKDMNLSEGEKSLLRDSKDEISKSIFEERPEVFEACQLYFQILSSGNKGDRQMKIISSEKLKDLMRRFPKLAEEGLPILDKDGKLIKDEVRKMNEFIEGKKRLIMLGYFDRFNGMSIDQIAELPKEERNKILLCAIASQRYINGNDKRYLELAQDGKHILETLCPNLDLNNKKELAEFFKNELEYKEDVSELSLDEIARKCNLKLKKVTEKQIIENVPTKNETTKKNNNIEIDLDSLDFEYAKRKSYNSVMKNYFINSQIDFTEKEVMQYDKLYQNATIDSWLENKKNVIKLRYAALLDVREEYRKNPTTTYVEKDLNVIEKEIKEFEEKYGKIDITPEEGEVALAEYKKNFAIAELTKYLTRDASDWSEGTNYADLDDSHKKGYIKRILVALNNKEVGEPYIEKIALRRLELMNSEGREFIKKNKNGEFEINKELLLQEYQKMFGNTYIYSSFEELMQSIKLREKEYVLEKLEEYTNLPPDSFKKLTDKNDREATMNEIEEIRFLSNQKRIHNIGKNFNIKNDKDIINKSIYESDMHMFEICKLHRELRDPKNVEHTQMYSIKLAEIKEFYKKHPQYRDMKLPILNEDGTLNDEEIMKMDQFSEAYQRIIIFEHLDEFYISKANSINELPKKDREHILLCAFAGLKYRESDDQDLRNLAKRCLDVIERSYPELDFYDEKQLATFFKEKIGFTGLVENISIDDVIEITNQELKEATENYIEKEQDSYVDRDIDFTALDLDSGRRKIYSSVMKNYFVGSKLNFSEKEEKKYNDFYNHVTVDAWIENKEDALKLRYMALNEIKNEYIKNPVGTYTENKLKDIEKDIKEFEAEYGKFDLDSLKNEISFSKYKKQFVYAGMTKYLTRDASDWSDGINYSDLDEEHKKGYIRNVLVALDNKGKNTYLTKIALRRLELMNTDENKFVEIYDNNKYKINKELILKEYKGMSDYEYSNFDELKQSVKLRENEYILEKLKEYTKIHENNFLTLNNKKDYKGSMEQIEKARYVSNQKKIQAMFDEGEKKDKEEPKVEPQSLGEAFEEKIKEGTLKVEDLNVAKGKIKEVEKVENQEETEYTRDDAQGEQQVNTMKVEEINDSATQKSETKKETLSKQEDKKLKSILTKTVKKAINTVKNFFEEHFGNKRKQGLLGDGTEKSTNSTSSENANSIKTEYEKFMESIVVTNKPIIQESQNISQSEAQSLVDRKVDEDTGRV